MIVKVYCIAFGAFFILPKASCKGNNERKTEFFHYRKCCKENQIYERTRDECVVKNERDAVDWADQNVPVSLVHGNFAV